MKNGLFISNKNDVKESEWLHPWRGDAPKNSFDIDYPRGNGIPMFRKKLNFKEGIKSVKLTATALGVFEVYVNGHRIGNEEMKPGWTDYNFRLFEYEYDITEYCHAGENYIFAEVSNGWWSGLISFNYYGAKSNAFCADIDVTYSDSSESFSTDESWETAIGGCVRNADIWEGEYYDATVPNPAFDPNACEEGVTWSPVTVSDDFKGEIIPCIGEPVRIRSSLCRVPLSATLHSGTVDNQSDFGKINIIEKRVGVGCEKSVLRTGEKLILDMGQNMVGRPRLLVRAKRGTLIKGFFAETLNDSGSKERGNDGPEGSLYLENYRTAFSRYYYVASGEGDEEFFPLHTFYAFRYFELQADDDIEILSVRAEFVGSDLRETAHFETSNEQVNKLWSNLCWGQRDNYLSIPTDCPQRNERLGWTGDTQVFSGAACYIADVSKFFKKWLGDLRDSQVGWDGAYCDVAPRIFGKWNNGNVAWGDAGVIIPDKLLRMYDDKDTLAEHYESMEYYMKWLEQFGLEGPNTAYGDWLTYDMTDKRYISVCFYAYDAALMEKYSSVLSTHDGDDFAKKAEKYAGLRRRIIEHFYEQYVEGDDLKFKTQAAYLLPLRFDMLDEELRRIITNRLERKIIDNGYKLSTGFICTSMLNQTLCDIGLSRLAYSLLLQTDDPSWLYSVNQGATTIWERWDSYTTEHGFNKLGMNSFNHYAFGAVGEWMMSYMAGIRPDEKNFGFKHFVLSPVIDDRIDNKKNDKDSIPEGQSPITYVKAHYDSPYGRIESAWENQNGKIIYKFTVPDSCTATLYLPKTNEYTINGKAYSMTETDGLYSFELVGGKYIVETV